MCSCSRFVLINHDDEPDDDRVNTCLRANGYRADIRKPFAGDSLGQLTDDLAMRLSEAFLHFCQDPFLKLFSAWMINPQFKDAGHR